MSQSYVINRVSTAVDKVCPWRLGLTRGCGLRSYLHGDLAVVDEDFPRQEVGADGRLIARAELLVDLFDAC